MKINVSIPLQAARWFSYLLILIFIEIIFILPLSNLLWLDFINRLIPNNRMHVIPLSNMANSWTVPFDLRVIANVTSTRDNEIRSDIPLDVTLNLGIYCTSHRPIEAVTLSIDDNPRKLPLACFDNLNFLSSRFNGFDSVSKTVKKDVINDFKFGFPVNPDNKRIRIDLKDYTEDYLLSYINVQFSVKYTGFRRFLLSWRRTCHLLGTLLFASLISSCFLLSFTGVFSYIVMA
ncbi:Fld1 [Kluyveromyces lactis]|nr:Fld1 [Kluyveromyces lactis]